MKISDLTKDGKPSQLLHKKIACRYCKKTFERIFLKKHFSSCSKNPKKGKKGH